MKRGDEVELLIERLATKGRSAARVDGRDVLVAGALPGDRVLATITSRRGRRIEARTVELLDESPMRTDPRCAFFGDCGGCRWQHLQYSAQLDMKREMVIDAFLDAGVLGDLDVPAVIAAEDPYHYRNKMEFSFGSRRWLTSREIASGEALERSFALGMFAPGRYDRVLDLSECHLPRESAPRVMGTVRRVALEEGWSPWDTRTNEGFLRHLVVRTPAHADEVLVNLVTSELDTERMARLADELRRDVPEVTTLVNTINTGVAQVSYGESVYTIFGDGVIHDRIGDLTFEIGPHTFFQTNTRQAERLYRVARDLAEIEPHERVVDLFCGIGAITLFVANDAAHVLGVELDRAAVDAARRNAERNGVDNVSFVAADLGRTLTVEAIGDGGNRADVVIVDPPRAGLHKNAVAWLIDEAPERIVYVSCNPTTQARDVAALASRYEADAVQPVDLFPHTDHVENVVRLRRK